MDFVTQIIIGELITKKIIQAKSIKYDQNTGVPYETIVEDAEWQFNIDDRFIEALSAAYEELSECDKYFQNIECDETQGIFGIEYVSTYEIEKIDVDEIQLLKCKYEKITGRKANAYIILTYCG